VNINFIICPKTQNL